MSKIAKIAASWWCKQIVSSKPNPNVFYEETDEMLVHNLLGETVNKTQLEFFKDELIMIIDTILANDKEVFLHCKQFPCEALEHCGNLANISPACFAWYKFMEISQDKIIVLEGKKGIKTILYEKGQ